MNGSLSQVDGLLQSLLEHITGDVDCIVFPPAIYLQGTQAKLMSSPLQFGAQNVYPCNAGAFTGELSGPMLREVGCRYVLVGHSERRQLFGESEDFVAEKFHHVKEHDMIPVLCVGETLAEREQGLTEAVLERQLEAIAGRNNSAFSDCIVAYEPVWAIGTGKTATLEQAQSAHAFIRHFVAEGDQETAAELSILYGGSVNAKNAQSLFCMPDIDGGLVGGASLDAKQFVEIVRCIK